MRRTQLRPMVVKPRPLVLLDRPGWIPPHITENWDTDPYAYQTEQEMMAGGGPHGQVLIQLTSLLDDCLKARQKMFLMNVFMLYRDQKGIKQRIGVDLLIMPDRSMIPHAYDLDVEPPPLCMIEAISMKNSYQELVARIPFYVEQLKNPTYLVISEISSQEEPREQLQLDLWRLYDGQAVKIEPDHESRLPLPEIGLKVMAKGQNLVFTDAITGQEIPDRKTLLALYHKLKEAVAKVEAAEAELRAVRDEVDQVTSIFENRA